jgi:sigma-E factor negative regulatory protein RseC
VIQEQARVVAVDGGIVEVVVGRQSACGSCAAKGGCGTSLLAAWFPRRELRFALPNAVGALPGDTVVLGLDERQLQRGSLLLYALPLGGLLLGAIGGEGLFAANAWPGELGGIAGGLLGLIAALWWVRMRSLQANSGRDPGVRLLRVAHRSTGLASAGIIDPSVYRRAGQSE